jgi:glycosyltransferase involved in cell wall biosynthesis
MMPSVSIAINNYNYDRFVAAAIESALTQTFKDIEVIVVDDGSIDESWKVVQSFGSRIKAIRTLNGGQGAAYMTGFEHSSGEFVLFLDSDDLLDADAVERCMQRFDANPSASKVQFQLRTINGQGERLNGVVPYVMHSGDVKPVISQFGHYAGPPASGNIYRRSAIAHYFPFDARAWKRAADTVPYLLCAFHGVIESLHESLGSYRLHTAGNQRVGVLGNMNKSISDGLDNEKFRRDQALKLLAQRSGIRIDGPFLPLPWSVRSRALAHKLEPDNPLRGNDSAWTIARDQWKAVRKWPGYGISEQLAMMVWTCLILFLPSPLVRRIAASNNGSSLRSMLKRIKRLSL